MLIAGKHGFGKDMDYNFDLTIPRELMKKNKVGAAADTGLSLLEKEAAKYGVNIDQGPNIFLDVKMTGSFTSPKFSITPKTSKGGSVGNAVQDKVNETVTNIKDSINNELKKKQAELKDTITNRAKEAIEKAKTKAQDAANKTLDSLKNKAKVVVSNKIDSLAKGVISDSLKQKAHAFKKPWLIAPAMNVSMYQHPLTQASLSKLQTLGCTVLGTETGSLACGEHGEGRLLEPEVILSTIETTLRKCNTTEEPSTHSEKCKLHVLVTSGGTSEPIDAVRAITNTSTGRTGALIVDRLLEEGHSVHFLTAENGERPLASSPDLKIETFVTFQELAAKLEASLGATHFDTVIHAAAVANYSLVARGVGMGVGSLALA